MFKRIACLLIAATALALPAMSQTQPKAPPAPPATPPSVGLREVVLPDSLEPAGIRTWLWYPTRVPPEPWMANIYLVHTRTNAVPIAVIRRPPKNGVRCLSMRIVIVFSDRFPLVR